jgi:hypothetical protein
MLYKTVQILGQILKNQYSKIPRARKIELVDQLFQGPLRALRDFWSFLEQYPDALAADIETALRRRDRIDDKEARMKVARTVVAAIVEMVTVSFFLRAAESANSESLNEEVRSVVSRNKTLAYRLIELLITLDSPRPIPRGQIKRLNREASDDPVASRLIRVMVLRRLYMFRTAEKDMQWLANELDLDITKTHAIGYQTHKILTPA